MSPDSVSEPIPVPDPAPIYIDMHNRVFTLNPKDIGINPTPETPSVWGVLMEIGYSKAVITLLSLADGTTSLYFGVGGGIIGGGEHEFVAKRSKAFIVSAVNFLNQMTLTDSFPLPRIGRVRFYVLTFDGVFTADAAENELGNKTHSFSPLFYSGQDVITQLRLMAQ